MKTHFTFYILLTFFGGFLFQSCTEGNAQTEPASVNTQKRVSTISAKAGQYQKVVRASGRLGADEDIRLSFKTGGLIDRIFVSEGDRVKRGQQLASLDLEEIQAQVQQADAGLRQAELAKSNAEIALERAQRDQRNVENLFADSVATLEQKEDVNMALRAAQNQLKTAEQGIRFAQDQQRIAQFNLQHSAVYAPSNGLVQLRLANAGELIGPGQPVLLFGTIEQSQAIRVQVTDKDVIFLKNGDPAKVHFDAYPGEIFEGAISEIAGMADPYTGTYEVKIAVNAQGRKLYNGFIGAVEILPSGEKSVVRIPVDALVRAEGQQGLVFIANQHSAKAKTIQILGIEGDQLLVGEGLSDGDPVIVQGAGYLQDGDPILLFPSGE